MVKYELQLPDKLTERWQKATVLKSGQRCNTKIQSVVTLMTSLFRGKEKQFFSTEQKAGDPHFQCFKAVND